MITKELTDFIKQQLQLGISREKISQGLITNGWTMGDVEEGFRALNTGPNLSGMPEPVSTEQNTSKGLKPTRSFAFYFFLILWYALAAAFTFLAFLAAWATDPTPFWIASGACLLIFEIQTFYCFWQKRKNNLYSTTAIVLTILHIALIPLAFFPSSSIFSIIYFPSVVFSYLFHSGLRIAISRPSLLLSNPLSIAVLILLIIFLINTIFGIIVVVFGKKKVSGNVTNHPITKKLLVFGLIVVSIALVTQYFFNRQISNSEIKIVEMQVKKSDEGICYERGKPGYNRDMGYTGYDSIEKCLESGGILPETSNPDVNLTLTTATTGTNGWRLYTNAANGFSLQAPEDYVVRDNDKYIDTYGDIPDFFVSGGKNLITGSTTKTALTVEVPESFYSSETGLKDATFTVNINDKLSENDCKSYKYGVENIILTETRRINDVNFYTGSSNGSSYNNQSFLRFYHTYQNGICYELIERLRITNLGMENVRANHQIDRNNFFNELDSILNTKLDNILSTFRFIESTS